MKASLFRSTAAEEKLVLHAYMQADRALHKEAFEVYCELRLASKSLPEFVLRAITVDSICV